HHRIAACLIDDNLNLIFSPQYVSLLGLSPFPPLGDVIKFAALPFPPAAAAVDNSIEKQLSQTNQTLILNRKANGGMAERQQQQLCARKSSLGASRYNFY